MMKNQHADSVEQEVENFDMDVLADVLSATRISNTLFCQKAFKNAWRIQTEPINQASFNIVSRGTCWLRLQGVADVIQLVQGDVALYPHGTKRVLSDCAENTEFTEQQNPSSYVDIVGEMQNRANDNPSTVIVGGCYHFEHNGAHPLLQLLPTLIHIRADEAERMSALQTTLRLLTQEVIQARPGAKVVTSRLVDVMLVYIIRTWLEQQPDRSAGWLGALRDAQIGKILGLIHREPQVHWTVQSLAQEASMSRAGFAKRFTDLVGEAPLSYLTRWRMDTAARLLRDSENSLTSITARVGYETESSFSKAFRRTHGVSPGQYRTIRS